MLIKRFKENIQTRFTLNELFGPFVYDKATINAKIPDNVKGNYILGNIDDKGEFEARYIGRADKNLKERIGHELGVYSYFFFSIAESARDAFNQECLMWHLGGEDKELDNKIHPDKPDNDHAAECWMCKYIKLIK